MVNVAANSDLFVSEPRYPLNDRICYVLDALADGA